MRTSGAAKALSTAAAGSASVSSSPADFTKAAWHWARSCWIRANAGTATLRRTADTALTGQKDTLKASTYRARDSGPSSRPRMM